MRRLTELLKGSHMNTVEEICEQARYINFERFDCPLCKSQFLSRAECSAHIDIEHPNARMDRPLFCEICLKTFADRRSLEQHESYHKRVQLMIERQEIDIVEPEVLLPDLGEVPPMLEEGHMQMPERIIA